MSGGSAPSQNFYYDPKMVHQSKYNQPQATGYTAAQSQYSPTPAMQGAINQFGQLGDTMQSTAEGLMSGQSPLLQQQRQQLMGGLSSLGAQQAQTQGRMLAARGMGGGGLRSALGSGQASALGEQARQGLLGIAGQGMQQGLGMLGQMYGQTGQMASQADANALQSALANMAAQNQASQFGASASNTASLARSAQNLQAQLANQQAYNNMQQYGITGSYNQAANNQAASGDFASNLIGTVGSLAGNLGSAAITAGTTKAFFMCIPEGTKIDTKNGKVEIDNIKAGDEVIGYNGTTTTVMQKHEYKEDSDSKRFLEISLEDGNKINLCDMHRIEGKHSKEYNIGDNIGDKTITDIKLYDGVNRSYDLLTSDKGYRISDVPINSMIEELAKFSNELEEVYNG